MRIHTEELVHIVGELHVARAACHQDVLAEAHFLHIGKGQVEVEHTLYQMAFQGAVEGQVCLHLVVVSCQGQLQVAPLQRRIRIDVAEVELTHVGV